MDLGESFMDGALEFDRVEPAKYASNGFAVPEIISALRQASQGRVAANQDFQKDLKDIDRWLARKNRKSVSLNEEVRRKEREEDLRRTKDKKDREAGESEADDEFGLLKRSGPVFKQGYYNDEVLAIAVDYSNRLQGLITAKK
jgi:carboxyl-terminal processing protease